MDYLSSMLGGGGNKVKYVAPDSHADVRLSHGVERCPSGPGCEIVYDVTLGTHQRVRRRYVHFRALHAAVKKRGVSQLPECAPERTMQELAKGRSGEATDRIIGQRTMRLQVYLQGVLAVANESDAIRVFLDAGVGAWEDPPNFVVGDEPEPVVVDDGIEDPEVAASVREQRAALARAKHDVEKYISERQALDAASQDGHDPASSAVTALASELAGAREACSCAAKHKDRLEQLRSREVDAARRQARWDQAVLVDRVAALRAKTVEGDAKARCLELGEAAKDAAAELEKAVAATDVEEYQERDLIPARAAAAKATEEFDRAAKASDSLCSRLAAHEKREAEAVAEAAQRFFEAADAKEKADIAADALAATLAAGAAAYADVRASALVAATTCDDRATKARRSLLELRRTKRLWRALDASRKEMVGAAATREAARIRDGALRGVSHRLEALEAAFEEDDAKATLTAGVFAADAVFSARLDASRKASKRVAESRDARDRARADLRSATLTAALSRATAAECVTSANWLRKTTRLAQDKTDQLRVVRDDLVRVASEVETEARALFADREERLAELSKRAVKAADLATEAAFDTDTRRALLAAAPAFAALAQDTIKGLFPEEADDPIFPADLVARLTVPDLDLDKKDDATATGDDFDETDPPDFADAVADAQALLDACAADVERLKAEHADALVRVHDERADVDGRIHQARERVAAAERAIARLTAYSGANKHASTDDAS